MSKWTSKQILYLTLAILGIGLPWYFLFQFFGELGQFDWGSFFAGAFANPAASSLTVDFMIVLVALLFWMIPEARKSGMRNWWIYVVFMGLVSAAFAISLFLFMRDRRLQSLEKE